MGEVTKETRTLATHLNAAGNGKQTAVMEYRSDYLGRMQHIVYPDGEKIVYGYDDGGQVVSVTGTHFNEEFKYVSDIGYDEYGQRLYIDYGNGVRTDYNYNKERRWLDSIETKNKWNVVLQNISYDFDRVGNVSGYTNACTGEINGSYSTKQNYSYDGLYQLTFAEGETVYNPYKSVNPEFKSTYRQEFSFDQYGLGNMTAKKSSEVVTPNKKIGDDLNYNLDYVYDDNFAHRLVSIGNRYYKYDSNGNVTVEQDGSFDEETSSYIRTVETDDRGVKSTDYGWGLFKDTKSASESERYKRVYTWDEKNRLIASADSSYTVSYVYSEDGERTNKYTLSSETLYFNKMWTLHTDAGNATEGGQTSKHIYLGDTRIVTKLNSGTNPTYSEEYNRQYYYHADHLGSAHLITDKDGNEYQRLEYTPYGEIWVEKTSNTGLEYLPYKFTGKEMDSETGLYYYGARYLDPKYSRWLSTDPALGEYMSGSDAGCGGAYNSVNFNLYHYGNNNPVKYTDPNGMFDVAWSNSYGNYDIYAPIKTVNTGNNVADGILGTLAGSLNLIGGGFNVLSNGVGTAAELAGAGFEAIDRGIDFLDENIPDEYTLTGNGVRQDLLGFEAVGMANPQLIADGIACIADSAKYLSATRAAKAGNVAKAAQTNKGFSVPEPLENHSIQTGKVGSLKAKGTPNSSIDLYNKDGDLLQRRFYGNDGRASLDVDFSHGNGDGSHTFPHMHKWDWTKNPPRE